jgi:hypothetical protein
MKENRAQQHGERLGHRPDFDEWAAEVASLVEQRRETASGEGGSAPARRRRGLGRARYLVARIGHLL